MKYFTSTLGSYIGALPSMGLNLEHLVKNLLLGLKTGLFSIGDGGSLGLHSSAHLSHVFLRTHNKRIYFGVVLVPTLICTFWFAVFGGTAIHMEMFQSLGIADEIAKWYRDWIICCYFTSTISTFLTIIGLILVATFSLLLPIQQHLLFQCKRVTEAYHRK